MRTRHVLLASGLFVLALLKCQPIEPIIVLGQSMHPTLEPYQIVWGTRDFDQIRRGDLVVFSHDGERMIKRVAGLPGDKVTSYLFANEWQVPRTKGIGVAFEKIAKGKRTVIVPAGSLYVVGDNTTMSVDSRKFGPISASEVEAKIIDQYSPNGTMPCQKISKLAELHRDGDTWS